MNSYQLISKLRKVRDDTYLTTAAQALYHELVAICNEMKWKDVFFVRSNVLCRNLDMSDNTLRKSRSSLAASGLVFYETSKDKRIGCYYSFVKKISNDIVSPAESSAISYSKNEDDIENHIKDEDIDSDEGRFINDMPASLSESSSTSSAESSSEFTDGKNGTSAISSAKNADDIEDEDIDNDEDRFINDIPESSATSSSESSAKIEDDKKGTSAISSANFEDETQIPPIIDIKTINKEESLARTHESTPPKKPKSSKKKEGDEKPLIFPFTSIAFMSAWETLRQSPKWKKKLNYALQLSLDKLSKFEEEFAIRQIERAIESNWAGVVFTGTERDYQEWLKLKHGNNQQNRGTDSKGGPKSAGIKSISFG